MPDLFTPLSLGVLSLPNRILMAPLTRNRAPETIPMPLMAEYYAQRASAGLIITEGAQISPQGVGYPATPGIHSESQVRGWRQITAAVHQRGGRIFIQLWHCGRISHPDYHGGELPVAPSAIRPAGQAVTCEGMKDFVTPRALATDEIPAIIDQYRQAAANAMAAGFDGIEIHAANGYLIDQFIRDGSNRRTDRYGGALDNRLRLLLEVTAAVVAEIGSERTGVRLSPVNGFNDMHDSDPQATFTQAATALSVLHPVYLHVVEVTMTGEAAPDCDMQAIRRAFSGLYVANGDYDRARAQAAIRAGRADLVSFGKLFLANPDLPARFAAGAPLNAPDVDTFYGGDARGYTDYPAMEESSSGQQR